MNLGNQNICLLVEGSLYLTQSFQQCLPTYYLFVLHLPVTVEKEIDRLRRRFLWTSNPCSPSSIPLMKWHNICRHKHQDGLGIINLRSFCSTLKCKLIWQLLDSNTSQKWPSLIKNKYLLYNGFSALLNISSSYSSPLWQQLGDHYLLIFPFLRYTVNNGRKILFWYDHWRSNCPLKYVFPDLDSVAKNRKCTLQKLVGIYLVKGKT